MQVGNPVAQLYELHGKSAAATSGRSLMSVVAGLGFLILPVSRGKNDLLMWAGGESRGGEREGREHENQCFLMKGGF